MKHLRSPLVVVLGLALTAWFGVASNSAAIATAQTQSTALERGYRTGYSDGYNAGYRDVADNASRNYQSKEEYQRADRSYNEAWGTLETYRNGYQQGFEAGYTAGYDRQPFNSAIPTGLSRRSTQQDAPQINTQSAPPADDNSADTSSSSSSRSTESRSVSIHSGAVLTIELDNSLSTDASQPGDRFQARVMEPGEIAGAIIDGRVTRVKRPGKVKGVAELQLAFDQIRMPDNRATNFSAEVVEVVDTGGRDVGSVDPEGGVKGKDSTKDDVSKVGAAAGIGAIVGAIIGGGKGAAIGAGVGGAAGTGRVLTKRGQDIRLERGQQLRIRTSAETQIQ
ncbi:MAG: hypothetical protein ND895_20480 [Pyrinomonadaceae bacterium]|nr:hypothetical protein [Pyrinomonadaceae bacterium]